MLVINMIELIGSPKYSFWGFVKGVYYLTLAKYTEPDKHLLATTMYKMIRRNQVSA